MIKVKISKKSIEISGHAKYAAHGKDIVCAAVSSITITTVNAILKFVLLSILFICMIFPFFILKPVNLIFAIIGDKIFLWIALSKSVKH